MFAMCVSRCLALLALAAPITCIAQNWELGGTGGYGWYSNPTISNGASSATAGFPPRGAIGAVFGNNMYEHVGGELRYLLRFGGPELKFNGLQWNMTGYTNVIVYDVLVHTAPRDEKLRPFFAGGAGIKVFTSNGLLPPPDPTLGQFARLRSDTQVEPVISAGAGLKYRFRKHAQFRVDFRTYFSPLPDDIFRHRPPASIRGWVFDFVPMAGLSYVF